MITVTRRRLALGLAFVAVLSAAMMAPSEEVARPPKKVLKNSAAPVPQAPRRVSRETQVPPLATFERHIGEKFVVVDLFESKQLPGPPPAPPAAPLPPKLPFTYMGRVGEEGQVKIVLIEGDKVHIVAKGGEFAKSYRLDEVGAEELVLTYLPLAARQSLSIGEKK